MYNTLGNKHVSKSKSKSKSQKVEICIDAKTDKDTGKSSMI